MTDAALLQRSYYRATAVDYDRLHVDEAYEHSFALRFMASALEFLSITSVLDVGAGTGRTLLYLKERLPYLRILGVEPSPDMREQGYKKGLSHAELIGGDAQSLPFRDKEFDLVCEYGVLHHIPNPHRAVSEMLRVARKGIFLSDCNNFGTGRWASRAGKQVINALGLWPSANWVKTRGKRYHFSEGDGIAYSYSIFNNYQQIHKECSCIHLMNTGAISERSKNLYRSASHVALLGIK